MGAAMVMIDKFNLEFRVQSVDRRVSLTFGRFPRVYLGMCYTRVGEIQRRLSAVMLTAAHHAVDYIHLSKRNSKQS
jgi:hypothetical protein